ncbi:MAG: hypothetical protein AVDCRST_MAG45-2525 [uncultured Solirubrobacterales bacterium]|uniref:Phosphatidic acid phosphatase type 2/haloperoxidase domain-containing protein n=1 Tax=uncultured Solirubrobacterales bacterium TaxID=768556 RepID=A0A6J4TEJ7_9ACTN|nr:MAG: hypothetical protein AVDCRST_MAG45-2525 [uncultured Solirubrobacterales bacterium]
MGIGLDVLAHQVGSLEFYWAIVAELFLPVWAALLWVAPRWSGPDIGRWRFRAVGFGAALLASLITLAGKTLEVWPGNPLFPSGHTAFAVTIAVFLVGLDRRWLRWVIALLLLLGVALVLSFFHVIVDIAGGTVVGLSVGIVLFGWLRRSEERRKGAVARDGPAGVSAGR